LQVIRIADDRNGDQADPHAVRVRLPPSALGEVCGSPVEIRVELRKEVWQYADWERADRACGC